VLFLLWLSVGGGGVLLWLPCHSLAIVGGGGGVGVVVSCSFLPREICKSHVHCSLSDVYHECKYWVCFSGSFKLHLANLNQLKFIINQRMHK
jgi:hypothetical protein